MFSAGFKRKAANVKLLQNHSVPSVAKELDAFSAHQYLKPMPIYAHWFAIEFLKVLNSTKSQLSNKTLSAMMKFNVATETFVFDISLLETASDAIKEACAMKSTTVDSVAS